MDREELIQAIDNVLKIIEPHPPLTETGDHPIVVSRSHFSNKNWRNKEIRILLKTTLQKPMNTSELEAYLKMPSPLEVKMAHEKPGRR